MGRLARCESRGGALWPHDFDGRTGIAIMTEGQSQTLYLYSLLCFAVIWPLYRLIPDVLRLIHPLLPSQHFSYVVLFDVHQHH